MACLSRRAEQGKAVGTRARHRAEEARRRLEVLTAREREVFTLVGGGASNAEIAKSLFMGEGTVKTHVSRILAKLDCSNRVQAAILAHDAQILPPA